MRDILTSPRILELKRTARARALRLGILLLALFIAIVGALGYFSSNHRITINTIEVKGTRVLDPADIQSRIKNDLAGKYFYLFSKANSFIYPHRKIYANLVASFPSIETLSVVRTNWNTLLISIAERSGSYLYCGASVPQSQQDIGENCYFVNNDGYVFDKAPYFSGNVYVKYYADLPSGSSSPLGTQMLPPEHFHDLARFVNGVAGIGLEPIHIVLESDGNDSLYLNHEPLDTTPKIIFKDDANMATILDNISLAMTKPEFANEIKSKYTRLLYIDLRFNNKVLYKFN